MRTVLLGDSHLARIRRQLPMLGSPVVNAAVGGTSSRDLAGQAAGASVAGQDVVVVSIGTNDAAPWKSTPPEDFAADLTDLLERSSPRHWIYLTAPGVDEQRLGRVEDRTNAVVARYREIASTAFLSAGGSVLPTHELIRPLGGRAFTEDGVHLSGAGYAVLLDGLRDLLDRLRQDDPSAR